MPWVNLGVFAMEVVATDPTNQLILGDSYMVGGPKRNKSTRPESQYLPYYFIGTVTLHVLINFLGRPSVASFTLIYC